MGLSLVAWELCVSQHVETRGGTTVATQRGRAYPSPPRQYDDAEPDAKRSYLADELSLSCEGGQYASLDVEPCIPCVAMNATLGRACLHP